MDLFDDVRSKFNKKNQILFNQDSACLQPLADLLAQQKRRTIVMWALDCAQQPLLRFEEKYPAEERPRLCLASCAAWARGDIRMPQAKPAILACHAVAKEINDAEYAALCHAIGQAGSTVHTERHGPGLPMYELTAIVLQHGIDHFENPVSEKLAYYYDRLLYWQENTDKLGLSWASFLADKDVNK